MDRLTELRFYVSLNTKIGHFGDVLPSQSLGVVLKKLNLTKQKQTTQIKQSKIKTHKILNLNKRTRN